MANLRRSGDWVELPLANEVTGVATGSVRWLNLAQAHQMFFQSLSMGGATRVEGPEANYTVAATVTEILGIAE